MIFAFGRWFDNSYAFFVAYVVVQYIVLGTAWNILGGYTGYVNFGVTAFFALGAYSTVVLHKLVPAMPLPVMILIGGALAGLVGLGTGYLTLRLRGVFFSIATLALAVVVQTLITNWDFVGGARGAYVLRPRVAPLIGGDYVQYLFLLMLGLCVIVLATARAIERSALGYGFAAIRDDEAAAEASGVPTLRLKLIATTLSGGFMGMAGAPLPYYVTYLDPASGFSLNYAVNAIAMPLIGGTGSWLGPVIGAVLVGGLQEYLRVTISSAVNVLVAGVLMVAFVIAGPAGHRRPVPEEEAMTALLQVSGLSKRFGGFVALDGIDLEVQQGERLGLIGPNGSGKSTLVNCICGTLHNETGSVRFADEALDGLTAHQRTRRGLARSFQLPRPFTSLSLAENVRIPILYSVNARGRRASARRARSTSAAWSCWAWSGLAGKARQLPRDLTQIEMRKLELARAMAAEPEAADRRRGDGGPEPRRGRRDHRAADPAERAGRHRDHDRAHHAGGDGVLPAARRAGGRQARSPTAPKDVVRDPEVVKAYLGE